MDYLLKVAFCWLVFYALYHGVLEKTTFFRLNRSYLLITLMLGLLAPLLRITLSAPVHSSAAQSNWLPEVVIRANKLVNQPFMLPEFTVRATVANNWNIWLWIYWAGVVFCLLRFAVGLYQLYRLYRRGSQQRHGNYILVYSTEVKTPFSFFHYLFWPAERIDQALEDACMLQHEKTHILQGHSIDVLLSELIKALCWFNPLAYLYSHALRDVHEYLADAAVLKTANRSTYGRLLIQQSLSGPSIALVNHFSTSQLKKRINMMKRKKTQGVAQLQYVFALPLIVGLGILFAHIRLSEASDVGLPGITVKRMVDNACAEIRESSNKPDFKHLNPLDSIPIEVFCVVENMPEFPGGQEAMFQYLGKNIRYPANARKNNQEGMVAVGFIVGDNGVLNDVKILKGVSPEIDAEALRVVKSMPSWQPGVQRGNRVNVNMVLPIKFLLEDKGSKPKLIEPTKSHSLELPILVVEGHKVSDDTNGNSVNNHNSTAPIPTEVFTEVEKIPSYKGGFEEMFKFLGSNLKYPAEASEKGIEGMVIIRYIVEKDGLISNANVVKGIGFGCDEEALRVVNAMPNWNPGLQNGKTVRVQFNLPIRFKLEEDKTNDSNVLKLQDFKAAPNPSNGLFNLSFRAGGKATNIEIFNLSGQKVYSQMLNNFDGYFNGQIDLSKQPTGEYIIRIAQGGEAYTQKLIKE